MVSENAAAANADSLIYNVMFSFYTACASFIGQNWGAGNKKRMLKSYRVSLIYAFYFRCNPGWTTPCVWPTVSFSVRYGTNSY